MYRWELFEGKDRPKELVSPYFETGPETSTMALMWSMTRLLWVTVKTVIMYGGFCVLKGFIGMYEMGVYGSAVANKRRYFS